MPFLPVPLQTSWLDDIIRQNGVNLYLYQVSRCPCLDASGYVNPSCSVCGSTGFAKGEPKAIRALLTAHDPKKNPLPEGIVETAVRSLTPARNVRLAEGDWVRMRQYPVRSSEVLTYGVAMGAGDRVEALFPVKVLRIQAIRDGKLYTFDPAEYTDISDERGPRTILPDGAIPWQPNASVHPGERLTVQYTHFEAYTVFRGSMPMQRGAQDRRLPDRALVRLITRRNVRVTPTQPDPWS